MSRIDVDASGLAELADYVEQRAGRAPARMVDDARGRAPIESGALKASGRVVKIGRGYWKIIFGEGLPDARAVYQEVGTGPHFYQPTFVGTDFSPLKGEHDGSIAPRAYIRFAVYRERTF